MTRVDAWLGRVTMYRTVSLALGAVVAVAAVLSAAGVVHVDLVALLVSVVVAVGVVLLLSRACGALWKTRVHTESSVITGLILVLLFRPGLDVPSLGGLAAAAAVAAVSKFVLAVRARHIANPAAAGALVVGVLSTWLGVLPPMWWVATPALLPVVAAAGAVVVLRTRRALLVATYLGVAVSAVVIRQVADGTAPVDALWSTITSHPLLFAAAFMVTEPLTLPPRRWQQLTEAALVGLLTAVPFTLGPLWSTPELALVVGNVLAFSVGQRRAVRLRVVGHRQVTGAVQEVAFTSERALRFRPGQWIELHLPHDGTDGRGSRRVFSVASPPGPRHGPSGGVAVAFRVTPAPSSFKRTLVALPPGGMVRATAVGGDFLLPRRADVPLLLVAGGIGITPFVSQLGALARSGERRDVVLLLLLSPGDEPPYVEVMQAAGVKVVVVAPHRPASLPEGWRYVAGPLLTDEAVEQVPDAHRRLAYVSGPPRMVVHARRTLRRAGVRRVRTDAFTGY
ncbi:FAD-dependent oxidoreductase [Cellulomonas sp. URHB0016]